MEDSIAAEDDPTAVYPMMEGGILQLAITDLNEVSTAHDEKYLRQGIKAPDELAFRGLPRTPLPGWIENYWQQRAHSTAAIWHFLEAQRRAAGRGMGFQGIAVELTQGMPYLAYGLDAGGYLAFAVSPHAGHFALGVHPYSRYCRIQANWDALPLRSGSFDVVILNALPSELPADVLPDLLRSASKLLTETGFLLISDSPEVEESPVADTLRESDLKVALHSVPGTDDSLNGRLKHILRMGIPVPPLLIAGKTF